MMTETFKSTAYLKDFKDDLFFLDEAEPEAFMINQENIAVHQADYPTLLNRLVDDMDVDEQEALLQHLGFRKTKIDDWE